MEGSVSLLLDRFSMTKTDDVICRPASQLKL